ncbi:hypothetical protein DSO57_1022910 [Entomophthora muscae]|uniref:Uncharacterized protein n=1 Tax=Entomophthora muscae TaxID=34485 RepID=A0ACC2SRU9_9FUNG|nr:hypothetical protein DSO57_1022910 [Entomophthora muscae]
MLSKFFSSARLKFSTHIVPIALAQNSSQLSKFGTQVNDTSTWRHAFTSYDNLINTH